jgi:two-component system sensor histidine kinase DegS
LIDLQEQERRIVAHDIHDGFIQKIVGAHMIAQSIHPDVDPSKVQERVAKVSVLLSKAIGEGRHMIRDLRPMVLDEQGIVEAVQHLIAEEHEQESFSIAFEHDVHFDRLEPKLEGVVFRIVQEALNNVKRHAQTDHATVRLTETNGQLEVFVRDQGVGFDPNAVTPENFGLRGIKERARLFGGSATIESSPGHGTTVHAQLPIVAASA